MNWMDFAIRMFAALFLGGTIGLERQWRQRMTELRTNGLVAVGSAMFVMMGRGAIIKLAQLDPLRGSGCCV